MELLGANKFLEKDNYTVYAMSSVTAGQYLVVLPNGEDDALKMFVDLHYKSSMDGLSSGSFSKDELGAKIDKEYKALVSKFSSGILVLPMTIEEVYNSAVRDFLKQKMFDEVKKIGAITSEVYSKLVEVGIDKQKVDQKILMVEKNDVDVQFVNWLKEQIPNFVDGVLYEELESKMDVNPFIGMNPFESAKEDEGAISSSDNHSDIFGNISKENGINDVTLNQDVVDDDNQSSLVFASNDTIDASSVLETDSNVSSSDNNFFGNVSSMSDGGSVDFNDGSNLEKTATLETPREVVGSTLEETQAMNPLELGSEVFDEEVSSNKKSGGFVNLIILMVVLLGVTIVSIELGKYLYSVYGA